MSGILYGIPKSRTKMCTICVDVIFAGGLALVSLLYPSFIITKNRFPVSVLGIGSSTLMENDSKGPASGKRSSYL